MINGRVINASHVGLFGTINSLVDIDGGILQIDLNAKIIDR
jgi:hypothetical protein